MARFIALGVSHVVPVAAGCVLGFFGLLHAQSPAPAPPPPLTNAAPGLPPPPIDDLGRYGEIFTPNGQAPYAFKLTLPFPDVGEVKVPHKNELDMRDKLERLATLSDAQIRDELAKWPAFSEMSLGDEGTMLTRLQQFRDRRSKLAAAKAHQLGLLTLNPQQQAQFEKEYWDKRLQMDRQLAQQFEPVVKASEQKMSEQLFSDFSSTRPPGAKPPGPKPPAPNPPKPAPPPVAAAH